jgi:hypothetical protein
LPTFRNLCQFPLQRLGVEYIQYSKHGESFEVLYGILMEVLIEASVIWYPEQSSEQGFFSEEEAETVSPYV